MPPRVLCSARRSCGGVRSPCHDSAGGRESPTSPSWAMDTIGLLGRQSKSRGGRGGPGRAVDAKCTPHHRQHALLITVCTTGGKRRGVCEEGVETPVENPWKSGRFEPLTRVFYSHTLCVETCLEFRLKLGGLAPHLWTDRGAIHPPNA